MVFAGSQERKGGKRGLVKIEARQKKNASLAGLFEETQTLDTTEETNKKTEKFTKLQREAQRIIDATRTPLENYNKEMELLNNLLKEGHINQETFSRAMEQAQEKLKKSSEKAGDVISDSFGDLGKTMDPQTIYLGADT